MNHRSRAVIQFVVFAGLLLAAKAVAACVCPDRDNTVLGKFEDARFVIVAKVIGVENTTAKLVVEKVYKGNLSVGEGMIFGQGRSANCFERFDDDEIGARFLLYLKPKTSSVWYADRCERAKALPGSNTNHVNDAADDLAYLEKLDQVTGKTRISGTLISYQGSPIEGGSSFKRMTAVKVRLIGEKETYETATNVDGVYEIYDLPPGRYTVEPETPKGWAIENPSAFGGGGSSGRESEHFQLTLKKGRHAYFDLFFTSARRVRGRVLSPSGNPMKNVCVNLIPTQGEASKYFVAIDCTEADGGFEIKEVPFGSFLIVVNNEDQITSEQPFRRFYYPQAYEREKAKAVTIAAGDDPETIDIHVPEVKEVVEIEGVFLSADRKPVIRAGIFFEAETTDELTDGRAFTRTDENGKFSLRVLKGLKGKLNGIVTLDEEEFRECPQVTALLKAQRPTDWRDQKTEAIEIQSRGNVNNMELKLPFASCKGGKITSLVKID